MIFRLTCWRDPASADLQSVLFTWPRLHPDSYRDGASIYFGFLASLEYQLYRRVLHLVF